MEKFNAVISKINAALIWVLFNDSFSILDVFMIVLAPLLFGSQMAGFIACVVWFWVVKPLVIAPMMKKNKDEKDGKDK